MTRMDEWKGLLDPDKRLLWQGQPSGKARFEYSNPFGVVFLIVMIAFPLHALLTNPIKDEVFALFLIVAVGLYLLVGVPVTAAFERRHTFFALTDKRALIWRKKRAKQNLASFPISTDTPVKLDEGRPRAIWFGVDPNQQQVGSGRYRPAGFERLDNPRDGYQLLRTVQRGEA